MTFGSLFSGIGGIDLGLERAGLKCRWQVENDPYATRILERHWPAVRRYRDVRTCHADELEPVDGICGGFPCQDVSQAGMRRGITQGTRSNLWFEFCRIIREFRDLGKPVRWVLIENVAGLLIPHRRKDGSIEPAGISRVVGELARLGYVGCYRSLRAKDFGASHLRKRVLILAVLADSDSGRFGELRQPPEFEGGLSNWRHAQLADNPGDLGRRQQIGLPGSSLPAGPGTNGPTNRSMADAGHSVEWRTEKPAGLDRGRPSGYDSRTGETLVDPSRYGQQGFQGENRGMRGRGVREAGEPLERVGQCACERCGARYAAFGYRPWDDDFGMLAAIPCPYCGGGCGSITYDTRHGGTGDPGAPDRAGDDDLADPGDGQLQEPGRRPERRDGVRPAGENVSDAGQPGLPDTEQTDVPGTGRTGQRRTTPEFCRALADSSAVRRENGQGTEARSGNKPVSEDGRIMEYAPGPADPRWPAIIRDFPDLAPTLESPLRGVADGVPDWVDRAMQYRTKRLGRLGNAVVPDIAEWLGIRLREFYEPQM